MNPQDLDLLKQIWQGAFSAGSGDKEQPQGKKRPGSLTSIDLHWEQLPFPAATPSNRKLEMQIGYLEEQVKQLVTKGQKGVWVIHGHGEGALCEAVRKWAKSSSCVVHFQTGNHPSLGAAATRLFLK